MKKVGHFILAFTGYYSDTRRSLIRPSSKVAMTCVRRMASALTTTEPAFVKSIAYTHGLEPRPRRFWRSPLFPSLGLLLGALCVFSTAPTQAQVEDVWTATLTVKTVSGGKGCYGDGSNNFECLAALSPQGFTYSSVAYKGLQLATYTVSSTDYLYLTLDKAIPTAVKAMTLCLGSTGFQLGNATVSQQFKAGDTVNWTGDSVPEWTVNQQVAVKLVTGTVCTAPAAPTGLSVTAGSAKLDLSWTAPTLPTGVTLIGYDVHYTTSAVGRTVAATGSNPATGWVAVTRSGTTASQTISSLSNGTAYRVRVRAKTSSANSAWLLGTGTPVASSNADLSGLTATSSTSASGTFTSLTLSPSTFVATSTAYTASVANARTHVKITPTVSDSNATVEVGKGSSLTTVTSGSASGAIALTEGSNAITVKVTAQDGSTTKTYTVTITRAEAVLAAPTNLVVSAGNAQLSLTWTAPTGTLTGYDVHYTSAAASTVANNVAASGSNPASAWVAVTRSGATASQTISSLSNGTPYRVRVRAKTNSSNGAWVFGSGTPVAPAPAAPTNLVVSAGNAQLSLTWTAPTGTLTGYDVHYTSAVASTVANNVAASGSNPASAWVAVTRSGTTASQTISSLSNSTPYRVRVRAKTSSSNGAWVFGTGTPVTTTPPTVSSDATLSALTATSSSSASGTFTALTLSPSTFSASTVEYLATVANAITHAKITATVNNAGATMKVGKGTSLTTTTSGSASNAISLSVGVNALKVEVTAQDGSTMKTYNVRVTREGAPTGSADTVTLSATPNPVQEGSSVTVTATLSKAATSALTIPVSLSAGTAETTDYGALTTIAVSSGSTTGTGTITTSQDTDAEDESFTVALGTLPSGYVGGSVTSVVITIQDDEFTGPRITLWAWDTIYEGGLPGTVMATLSEPAATDVVIRFTGTLGTAELADFNAASRALFSAGLKDTIPAGEYNAYIELVAQHDADDQDETFTVAIDTSSLPSGYGAGNKISHTVTIDDDEGLNTNPDLLTGLTIHDGIRFLHLRPNVAGDYVGLAGPEPLYTVQVSPGRRSVTVTPTWTNPDINGVTGSVRYVTYGRNGAAVNWNSSQNGSGMEVSLVVPDLGSPGSTQLNLVLDGEDSQPYRILFQHNYDWKATHDRLEKLIMTFRQ